jgi:hypothetical protein
MTGFPLTMLLHGLAPSLRSNQACAAIWAAIDAT